MLFDALCRRWHPGPSGSADGAADTGGVPPEIFEGLATLDAEGRRRFVTAVRRYGASSRRRFVHPTWVERALPSGPVLRRRLQAAMGSASVDDPPGLAAPSWVEAWWRRRLDASLPFPAPFPWRLDATAPRTFLWALAPDHSLAVVRRHGLRPLARLAPWLAEHRPRRLAEGVFGLAAAERAALAALAQNAEAEAVDGEALDGDALDDDALDLWVKAHDRAFGADPLDVPLGLGLAELAASIRNRGDGDDGKDDGPAMEDAIRLGYRWPRPIGRRLFAELCLESGPGPVAGDADLGNDFAALVDAGNVTPPNLDALRREVAA
ncbi:MAG: hypothetical protein AAGN66_01065 [Acidobacteriota bacterium]